MTIPSSRVPTTFSLQVSVVYKSLQPQHTNHLAISGAACSSSILSSPPCHFKYISETGEKMRQSQRSNTAETAPKLERKHVEKNRRDNLKFLYNHLFSLLPTHISLQRMSLPDQVGEAVKYIQSLQNQVEKSKQKKQELLQQQNINARKRPHHSSSSSSCCNSTIQVLDMGSGMDVVLIDGLEDTAAFRNILRVLHEHGLEVATATFQPRGNSTLHIVHQQGFGGTTAVYEKLKQVVNGSSNSEVEEPAESLVDSWYYDIWGFPIVETLPGQPHNPPPY